MKRTVVLLLLINSLFFVSDSAFAQCSIPSDQLVSGGPGKDGIPALTTPEIVNADEASSFMLPDNLVLGVVMNGEARAYPHNVLWWHEIINDVLGGTPIVVTYCPLTGSGIVFDPVINEQHLNFGVSGLLYENNLVMFDRATESLWSQMKEEAICRELARTKLKLYPVVQSTWEAWKRLYPDTSVVTYNTGFDRNYDSYPYGTYDQIHNTKLLFPHSFVDDRLPPKELVLGIRNGGAVMAYPYTTLGDLGDRLAINDELLNQPLLVVFDKAAQMAIPFARQLKDPTLGEEGRTLTFDVVDEGEFPFKLKDRETGTLWSLKGRALEGPLTGAQLQPIATYSAMWFAWGSGSFHGVSEIYSPTPPDTSN